MVLTRIRKLSLGEVAHEVTSWDMIARVQRDGLTESHRSRIVVWYLQLCECFELCAETAALASRYLDVKPPRVSSLSRDATLSSENRFLPTSRARARA